MADVKFENNILGFVPKDEWLDVGLKLSPTRANDPVDSLIGDEQTDNITAKWQTIADEFQVPVMAHFHGFDTETNTTFRIPVDNHTVEKGLIKVKINQSERMLELIHSGVNGDEELYRYVLADGVRLADQVATRSKVAKNEMLATGKVTIKENNLDLTVDYGVPSSHTNLALVINDDTDVPAEIQKIVDTALQAGVTITGIYTSKQVLSKLRANKSIQTAINGVNAVGALVRRTDLENYLSDEFGINTVVTNDLTYGADAKIDAKTGRPVITQKRYFPKDVVTFFGASNYMTKLGTGLWGLPPEMTVQQLSGAVGSGRHPYIYLTQWLEDDPAVLWTRASGLFMPVLYSPNSIYIAKVTEK